MRCKAGVITKLVDFGVTTKIEDQYQCVKKPHNICNPFLHEHGNLGIYGIFDRECTGKDSCIIQNYDKFINHNGDQHKVAACFDQQSRVFFQYFCEQTEEEISDKKLNAVMIVTIQLLCMTIIIVFIFAAKRRTIELVKVYHENNIQAVDYTMYIPLTSAQCK